MMIRSLSGALALSLALTACGQLPQQTGGPAGPARETGETPPPPAEIAEIVSAPKPAVAARTADQFDTTTAAQKQAAVAAPTGAERRLGEVVASLGDPTEPGLWVKTDLVSASRSGRVEYPASNKSAVVELRPADGAGGAQVSLAAMRLIEAPLTDLPTLVLYEN